MPTGNEWNDNLMSLVFLLVQNGTQQDSTIIYSSLKQLKMRKLTTALGQIIQTMPGLCARTQCVTKGDVSLWKGLLFEMKLKTFFNNLNYI